MSYTIQTFLIVCPLVFLAGFVDAIGGGGGLISLPAYLLAGVPAHVAIGTNKLSSCCGTALATGRFIKNKYVNFKLGIPSVICAMLGSYAGANASLLMDENWLKLALIFVLPLAAVVVLNRNLFPDAEEEGELILSKRLFLIVGLSALVIGFYDGFYGPGTGTFLIVLFTVLGHLSTKQSNGQAKIINLTTNLTSLCVFILHGQVLFILGICAAACNMLGAYFGSGLVMEKGAKIVRPSIIFVLVLLLIKIIGGY